MAGIRQRKTRHGEPGGLKGFGGARDVYTGLGHAPSLQRDYQSA